MEAWEASQMRILARTKALMLGLCRLAGMCLTKVQQAWAALPTPPAVLQSPQAPPLLLLPRRPPCARPVEQYLHLRAPRCLTTEPGPLLLPAGGLHLQYLHLQAPALLS